MEGPRLNISFKSGANAEEEEDVSEELDGELSASFPRFRSSPVYIVEVEVEQYRILIIDIEQ